MYLTIILVTWPIPSGQFCLSFCLPSGCTIDNIGVPTIPNSSARSSNMTPLGSAMGAAVWLPTWRTQRSSRQLLLVMVCMVSCRSPGCISPRVQQTAMNSNWKRNSCQNTRNVITGINWFNPLHAEIPAARSLRTFLSHRDCLLMLVPFVMSHEH